MDEDGQFTFNKPEPKEDMDEKAEKEEEQIELDPLAGSNIDQRDIMESQRQMLEGGNLQPKAQQNPPATRNKRRMSVGADKRLTGLPAEAGNQNVDRRNERRIP